MSISFTKSLFKNKIHTTNERAKYHDCHLDLLKANLLQDLQAGVPCKLKPSSETASRRNTLAVLCGVDLGGFHCSLKPTLFNHSDQTSQRLQNKLGF